MDGLLMADVSAQFILHVEASTLPIEMNQFNRLRQSINLFALKTLEKLDIKIAGAMAPAPPPPEQTI
jgi:hypothetical protein